MYRVLASRLLSSRLSRSRRARRGGLVHARGNGTGGRRRHFATPCTARQAGLRAQGAVAWTQLDGRRAGRGLHSDEIFSNEFETFLFVLSGITLQLVGDD